MRGWPENVRKIGHKTAEENWVRFEVIFNRIISEIAGIRATIATVNPIFLGGPSLTLGFLTLAMIASHFCTPWRSGRKADPLKVLFH